jgi:hypothetical protein
METQAFSSEQMKYAELMYAVMDELKRATTKFPGQSLPWGGGPGRFWMITGPIGVASQIQRAVVDAELRNGTATWFDVIAEEFLEAGAETGNSKDPSDGPQEAHDRLKAELVQVAAMALRAVVDLDARREKLKDDTVQGYLGAEHRTMGNPPMEPLLPPGGRHSGNCRCKGCAEPEPAPLPGFRYLDDENESEANVPPNAGSVS